LVSRRVRKRLLKMLFYRRLRFDRLKTVINKISVISLTLFIFAVGRFVVDNMDIAVIFSIIFRRRDSAFPQPRYLTFSLNSSTSYARKQGVVFFWNRVYYATHISAFAGSCELLKWVNVTTNTLKRHNKRSK